MEKRIELEKRHRNPDQVTELNLDNCKGCTAVEGLTDEFVNLHTLSLIGSGLTSLKGFPKLPKLKKLELSDNKISGGLQILKDCEKLTTLNLSGNRIKELSTLQDLKNLANLRVLDLFNNDITTLSDYRNKVFELLPQLVYLDGSDKTGKEYEESDEDDEEDDEEENGDVRVNGNRAAAAPSDEDDGGEEEELDEEESDEDEVGLKDIYNDNLEDDDESDIYEGEEEEDEDDNDISDESDAEGGKNSSRSFSANNSTNSASSPAAKESAEGAGKDGDKQGETSAVSRGTKRKLEDDGDS